MATPQTTRRLADYPVSLQLAAAAIYGDRVRQELDGAPAQPAPRAAASGMRRPAA